MGKKIDLTGKIFGKLTVIEEYPERTAQGSVQWKCQCECGNITIVSGDNLRRNHTLSCGCLQKESAQNRVIDLTGQRFGKLTVIGRAPTPKGGTSRHAFWYCNCDCGKNNLIDFLLYVALLIVLLLYNAIRRHLRNSLRIVSLLIS